LWGPREANGSREAALSHKKKGRKGRKGTRQRPKRQSHLRRYGKTLQRRAAGEKASQKGFSPANKAPIKGRAKRKVRGPQEKSREKKRAAKKSSPLK